MNRNHWLPLGLRWAARLSGLALIAFIAVFAVGHGGLPNLAQQPLPVQIEFAATFTMLAGFLAAWRWEMFGGILSTCGFAAFFATEMAMNGRPPGGLIPLFAVPGILFLVSRAIAKLSHSPRAASE